MCIMYHYIKLYQSVTQYFASLYIFKIVYEIKKCLSYV